MKGRVVACKEYGKPFEIDEYDVPNPEPGAVSKGLPCSARFPTLGQAGMVCLRPAAW